jgi:hypothetical protein
MAKTGYLLKRGRARADSRSVDREDKYTYNDHRLCRQRPDAVQAFPRCVLVFTITEQKSKLINLAESIAVKGFSPIDRRLVMRSAKRTGQRDSYRRSGRGH